MVEFRNSNLQNGAVMGPAGAWVRPQYYLRGDEVEGRLSMDQAITREVTGVRQGVGLVDVSTLGKIDLQGADSAEFLNRLYTSGWKTLPVGKARYGLMLREDGLAYDDGTTSRLADNHYMMTTTTGNAGVVMSTMEWYLQVVWPELDVRISSVTEQWAAMALAGPRARAALQAAVPNKGVVRHQTALLAELAKVSRLQIAIWLAKSLTEQFWKGSKV